MYLEFEIFRKLVGIFRISLYLLTIEPGVNNTILMLLREKWSLFFWEILNAHHT